MCNAILLPQRSEFRSGGGPGVSNRAAACAIWGDTSGARGRGVWPFPDPFAGPSSGMLPSGRAVHPSHRLVEEGPHGRLKRRRRRHRRRNGRRLRLRVLLRVRRLDRPHLEGNAAPGEASTFCDRGVSLPQLLQRRLHRETDILDQRRFLRRFVCICTLQPRDRLLHIVPQRTDVVVQFGGRADLARDDCTEARHELVQEALVRRLGGEVKVAVRVALRAHFGAHPCLPKTDSSLYRT